MSFWSTNTLIYFLYNVLSVIVASSKIDYIEMSCHFFSLLPIPLLEGGVDEDWSSQKTGCRKKKDDTKEF